MQCKSAMSHNSGLWAVKEKNWKAAMHHAAEMDKHMNLRILLHWDSLRTHTIWHFDLAKQHRSNCPQLKRWISNMQHCERKKLVSNSKHNPALGHTESQSCHCWKKLYLNGTILTLGTFISLGHQRIPVWYIIIYREILPVSPCKLLCKYITNILVISWRQT